MVIGPKPKKNPWYEVCPVFMHRGPVRETEEAQVEMYPRGSMSVRNHVRQGKNRLNEINMEADR